MIKRYDLIIVGGGLVGAGFAVALKNSGLNIALIDARMPSSDDPRLFALNVSSCQFLDNLGCWDALKEHTAPIRQVHVSHQGHFGAVRMHHAEINLPNLGHVVPAKYIEAEINSALDTIPHADIYRPARLKQLQQANGEAELLIETNAGELKLTTPLVIGADGTASTVRTLVNIPIDVVDYQQSALVARVILADPHQHVAYERFYQHGALALLPLPNNECASIISATEGEVARLQALTDDDYLAVMQKIIGSRVGKFKAIGQRHCFPLKMTMATRAQDGCVLLLGNAAHTLHPIAAQGFNLALYEVAVLVEGILEKRKQNTPITAASLHQLLAQNRSQQIVSVKVSHWLNKLFSRQSLPTNFLLSLGMTGFNMATPVKNKFMQVMTGRFGRVPSLLMRQNEQ